jgi:hypothetical protein
MSVPVPRKTSRQVLERLALIEDGAILRFAFFVMLAGTLAILFMDYQALGARSGLPQTGHLGDPLPPAIERPEIDPGNPAYRPTEQITTPREVLARPLSIELMPGGVLELTGTIGAGSAARFADEIERRGGYVETIALNSPGGSVEDALAIAAMVREKGFDTAVGAGAVCASSCPLILASGAARHVAGTASVGVHQIYAASDDADRIGPAQAMSDTQTITARIARHFEAMGVDPLVWMHALETPPDRLYYLTLEQMADYGLASAAS